MLPFCFLFDLHLLVLPPVLLLDDALAWPNMMLFIVLLYTPICWIFTCPMVLWPFLTEVILNGITLHRGWDDSWARTELLPHSHQQRNPLMQISLSALHLALRTILLVYPHFFNMCSSHSFNHFRTLCRSWRWASLKVLLGLSFL